MPPRFAIHLGAHKTATTHIQNGLQARADVLRAAGIAYFGPRELRDRGLPLPPALEGGPGAWWRRRRFRAALSARTDGARHALLSEENILGSAHNREVIRTGRFYPRGHERLRRLLRALGGEGVTLFLAVRDPAAYLASAYSQRLFSGRVERFEDFLGSADPAAMRWSELVMRLRQPQCRLVVWRHEDLSRVAGRLWTQMLPGAPDACMSLAPGVTHPGLSARAHAEIMGALDLAGGTGVPRDVVRMARRRFPKKGREPGFAPYDDDRLAASAAAYDADMARLRGVEGVTLLTS